MVDIPVIGQITDPAKVRVALVHGQQIVSAPATALSDALGIPAGGTTGQVLTKSSATDYDSDWADIPSQGDFSGPASAGDGNLVIFDGATGKLGKDSGKKPADFATAGQGAKADTAYQKSTILGTVSQSAGVPTGAIIERGSNANGTYVKFADGTLICFNASVSILGVPVNTATGSVFMSANQAMTYAASFIEAPASNVWVRFASGLPVWFGPPNIADNTGAGVTFRVFSSASQTTVDFTFKYLAIGKWF